MKARIDYFHSVKRYVVVFFGGSTYHVHAGYATYAEALAELRRVSA